MQKILPGAGSVRSYVTAGECDADRGVRAGGLDDRSCFVDPLLRDQVRQVAHAGHARRQVDDRARSAKRCR